MQNTQKTPKDYETWLLKKERELIVLRTKVWDFIDTPHKANDNKKYQSLVRQADTETGLVLNELLGKQNTTEQFRQEAEQICQKLRNLGNYSRDMIKILSDDLVECNRAEEKKTVDILKNVTFFISVPAAFITAVKNGLGESHHIKVSEAAVAGVGISSVILGRKRILSFFKDAKQTICSTPKQIKNSFLLFYMKETVKEKSRELKTLAMPHVPKLHNLAARARHHAYNIASIRIPGF